MKILITNQYIVNRAGTELFTIDLALELSRLGHNVYVYTSAMVPEVVAPAELAGVLVTDDIATISHIDFDVIHAQHNVVAVLTRSVFPNIPMVYMSHGVIPRLEQPPSIDIGISGYIAVSEEVRDNLIDNYGVNDSDISIIYNFVDVNKFHNTNTVNNELNNILVISNHYSRKVRATLQRAAKSIGATVSHVGLPSNPVKDIANEINKADLVVTLGRGILEAGACERNVLVYDIHGLDGMVTNESFYKLRVKNFSGRAYSRDCSVNELVSELLKYDPKHGRLLRGLIVSEHNKEFIVSKIIDVYNSVVEKGSVPCNRFWANNNILNTEFKRVLKAQERHDKYKSILHNHKILQYFFKQYKYFK
ncbi:MAG: glycosyltransferase [Candidatus Pacebacteria bacterium]|nr:glycosyltransferase [Candidatus Paceibacterota bacterium]